MFRLTTKILHRQQIDNIFAFPLMRYEALRMAGIQAKTRIRRDMNEVELLETIFPTMKPLGD